MRRSQLCAARFTQPLTIHLPLLLQFVELCLRRVALAVGPEDILLGQTLERERVRIFELGWANQSPILPAPELLSDKQPKCTQASSHQSHRLRPSAHLLRSRHDPVPVPAAAGGVLAAHADGALPLHHVVPRQR